MPWAPPEVSEDQPSSPWSPPEVSGWTPPEVAATETSTTPRPSLSDFAEANRAQMGALNAPSLPEGAVTPAKVDEQTALTRAMVQSPSLESPPIAPAPNTPEAPGGISEPIGSAFAGLLPRPNVETAVGPVGKGIAGAISGTEDLIEGVAQYLTSPQGLIELGLTKTPLAPAVMVKWAKDMVEGGLINAGEAKDAWNRGDIAAFGKHVAVGAGMLFGAGGIIHKGVAAPVSDFARGSARPGEANLKALEATMPPALKELAPATARATAETIATTEDINASTITSPTKVPELGVRPRVGQETPLRQPGEVAATQTLTPATDAAIAEAKPDVHGGAEADLPEAQRLQSQKNNADMVTAMKSELEAMNQTPLAAPKPAEVGVSTESERGVVPVFTEADQFVSDLNSIAPTAKVRKNFTGSITIQFPRGDVEHAVDRLLNEYGMEVRNHGYSEDFKLSEWEIKPGGQNKALLPITERLAAVHRKSAEAKANTDRIESAARDAQLRSEEERLRAIALGKKASATPKHLGIRDTLTEAEKQRLAAAAAKPVVQESLTTETPAEAMGKVTVEEQYGVRTQPVKEIIDAIRQGWSHIERMPIDEALMELDKIRTRWEQEASRLKDVREGKANPTQETVDAWHETEGKVGREIPFETWIDDYGLPEVGKLIQKTESTQVAVTRLQRIVKIRAQETPRKKVEKEFEIPENIAQPVIPKGQKFIIGRNLFEFTGRVDKNGRHEFWQLDKRGNPKRYAGRPLTEDFPQHQVIQLATEEKFNPSNFTKGEEAAPSVPKQDAKLQTADEISDRIESLKRQQENLREQRSSNYPDVNAKRSDQLAKLRQRQAALEKRLTILNKPTETTAIKSAILPKLIEKGVTDLSDASLKSAFEGTVAPNKNFERAKALRDSSDLTMADISKSGIRPFPDAFTKDHFATWLAKNIKPENQATVRWQVEKMLTDHPNILEKHGDWHTVQTLGARNYGKPPKPTPTASQGAEGLSAGPGAASPGDVPKKSQIEQLGSAFKGGSTQRQTVTEKVKEIFNLESQKQITKDLLERSLSALKTSGNYLVDTWKGQKDLDPLLKSKGILSAELEARGWRMRQAMKDMKRAVPDMRVREAISKYVDAGGDMANLKEAAESVPKNRRAPYDRAMALTPEEKVFAGHVQSYFESRLQEAIDAGVLKEGVEDYIHRIYPKETDWRKGVLNAVQNGILDTRKPGLAMKRVFDLDSEAEKAGYNPVNDFIPRVLDYEASLAKVISSRAAVKRFTEITMPDGRPLLDVAGIGVPIENAAGVREATLIKPSFKPGEKEEGVNYRQDYQSRDYSALKKWKWATKDVDGKPIMVEGNVLIHPDAVHRIDALLEPSKVRKYAAGRAVLGVGSVFKQTMLDFSGFHQVQIAIHGLEHKVNPFNLVKEIDFENPNVTGLLRGGVTLGGEHAMGMAQEGLIGRSLSRQIPGIGPLMRTYHEWLFQDFIPRVKMTMAMRALERNRARFKNDLASGKMTEDALFHQTAKEANAAFGGLNYIMLERSKTAQDMARMILLAPDFLEARGRFVGQAGTKLGGEQRMALFLGALTLYAVARVMNKTLDDQWHFEPENAFSVVHNGKAYSIRTVQGDVLHAIEEPVRFWLHRLNPAITRPVFELMTGRDDFGRKRTPWQVLGDTISNIVPISMRSGREQSLFTSLLNSFGGSVRRYSEVRHVYESAQEWKKKNGVREEPGEFVYDPDKDVYRPLKLAILDGDEAAAVREYKNLLKNGVSAKQAAEHFTRYAHSPFTGSKAREAKFKASLSDDDRKSYDGAVKEKQRILKGFVQAAVNAKSEP